MRYKAIILILLSYAIRAGAAQCNVTTQSVSFPDYDFFRPLPLTGTGMIWLQCDSRTLVHVTLDAGMNSNGNPLARQLVNDPGAPPLHYNLYLDASYSQVWGDGTAGSAAFSEMIGTANRNIVVYGRIPPLQNVAAGFYTDAVTVTIEW